MRLPKLTEVFLIEKNVKLVKCPNCGGVHIPITKSKKSGGGSRIGKDIRFGGAEGDPKKSGEMGEEYTSDHGKYDVFKVGTDYKATFIGKNNKAEDLGHSPSRKEIIDVILSHHDEVAAGVH